MGPGFDSVDSTICWDDIDFDGDAIISCICSKAANSL